MFNLADKEKEILSFWEKEDIFGKTLATRDKKKTFVFYEGPPTANGKPGLHHVLARAYKDIILRFKTMQGFYVPRKAGWDTHGLPVELEIEKELGINSKKGIEDYGIAPFISKAKQSVWKYKTEWEELTKRMGFWLDLEHPYITYESPYIESLWHIIQSFWERGLLEEDFKVVPWCYRCGTPLSSHELAQGYQKVTEASLYVKFRIKKQESRLKGQDKGLFILAWTTTPWTLPGNVALAVGGDIVYVLIQDKATNEQYILAKDRLGIIKSEYRVIQELKGKELVGLHYEPLFTISELQGNASYQVYAADFVTTQDGTGVVHTAVMYGEDDYQLGKKVGLPMFHTVTPEGNFISQLPEGLGGMPVKSEETKKEINNYLQRKGLLFAQEEYTHEYPFCWRCKNPLLYYATKSWFVRVTKVKERLIANNTTIDWHPEHLKAGRFGNFLEDVKDWAFSRERYWGTPLPIWECRDCGKKEVIGSIKEIARRVIPKNTFILMRHGESENNLTHTLSSQPEQQKYRLTKKGNEQAHCLAELLQEEKVEVIVASPVERTRETATIIGQTLGVSVEYDDHLREIDMGPFNGKTLEEYEAFWGSRQEKFLKRVSEGMENFHKVKVRMMQCLQELNNKYEGKTILIISHKGPLWVLEGALQGLSDAGIADVFPEDFESGEARKVYIRLPFNNEAEMDLHRPFIDDLVLRCVACKGKARRIPEVADVWFDSGAMPYAQHHWPFEKGQKVGKAHPQGIDFPADYICEAIDQTRGWFYTLLTVSTLLGYDAPYKHVISLGHLLDEKGRKMSKSLGNIIDPFEAIDHYGVDTIRWYFYVVNPPGLYKRFDPKEVLSHQRRFLLTLFNSANFLKLYGNKDIQAIKKHIQLIKKKPPTDLLDKWIFSLLHKTIQGVTESLERYEVTQAARLLESFVEDLSNWYIRLSRERFGGEKAPQAIACLYLVLENVGRLMAPFTPFSGEILVRDFLNPLGIEPIESVHLQDWPTPKKAFIDSTLEQHMERAREYVVLALALRAKHNLKVRQPLATVYIKEEFPVEIKKLIAQEVNVKQVVVDATLSDPIALDTTLNEQLIKEGFIREFTRQGQDLRKQAGLKAGQKTQLFVEASQDIQQLLLQERVEEKLAVTLVAGTVMTSLQKVLNLDDKEVKIGINNAQALPGS